MTNHHCNDGVVVTMMIAVIIQVMLMVLKMILMISIDEQDES